MSMYSHLQRIILLLAAMAFIAAPAGARSWVECRDGSSSVMVIEQFDPCEPNLCHRLIPPAGERCVIRSTPAVERIVPTRSSEAPKMSAAGIVPVLKIIKPTGFVLLFAIDEKHPPDHLWPEQGSAPRGPPILG
jgi:hypothetical protein